MLQHGNRCLKKRHVNKYNTTITNKFVYLCYMKAIKNIESKISRLTPGLIGELDLYLDYLINKREVRKQNKLKQDWAGGLKDIQFSSIDLQKKALDWRRK